MFSEQTIFIINVAGISFMVIMLVVLGAATRMKGGAGWAAFILVAITLPGYISNLWRDLHLGADHFRLLNYLRTFFTTTMMPALWFFAQSQLDKTFRLTVRSLKHAVLPLASLLAAIIYYAPMTLEQVAVEMEAMAAGNENLAAIINNYTIIGMFFGYFIAIFFYIRKRKKHFLDHYSDCDYITVTWTQKYFIMFFSLFFVSVAAYIISPRSDAWLCPIINSAGTAYLVYIVVFHSTAPFINRLTDAPAHNGTHEKNASLPALSPAQMQEICEKAMHYLASSGAYTNPDFSLSMLSVGTGISFTNLSRSLNGCMNKTFFDFINQMRVEEAKRKLLSTKEKRMTIETIAGDCGFRSRSAFYNAFAKTEGKSPTQWLKATPIDI